MAKILLVEDDPSYAALMCDFLAAQKYVVEVACNYRAAVDMIKVYDFDLLIVDWKLPDKPGIELVQELRASGMLHPVLILTTLDQISDKEIGFASGADDYLPKTSDLRELSVRIKALLRRQPVFTSSVLKAGHVGLDVDQHIASKDGEIVHLLPKEFALLEHLMRNPNRVFTAEELLDRVWPSDSTASPHTVQTCINRLRSKLDKQGSASLIQTLYKQGYKLLC